MSLLRRFGMQIAALLIAVVLWIQVHGQGEGSLSMDVPLQVQGLPADMVIVNDLPDRVRITITGLQSRLKDLKGDSLFVPLSAAGIVDPGVVERALKVSDIRLPVGLRVEKVQPDRLQLQVDRIITRAVPVRANLELPEAWQAQNVTVKPELVQLTGPEVWLDALKEVTTNPIQLALKPGPFEVQSGIESPSGKAIRLKDTGIRITVQGMLVQRAGVVQAIPGGVQ
ncbi:MAG TPA: CdaR family protein [Mariprofundaceae bacterium]|nr:CdaR family protein [Mariprofundaceae bacterium]